MEIRKAASYANSKNVNKNIHWEVFSKTLTNKSVVKIKNSSFLLKLQRFSFSKN